MVITRIEVLGKNRYLVYIDYEVAFVMYKGDFKLLNIDFDLCRKIEDTENSDAVELYFSQEKYSEMLMDILPKRAWQRCLFLLDKKEYTEKQLIKKLKEGYYPDIVIEKTIAKIKDYGFIDDLGYATRYIQCNIGGKSKRKISQELYTKGVNKNIIENAFSSLADEGIVQDEDELIRKLLVKRHYYESDMSVKEKSKQYAYLAGKGFSSSAIMRCLDSIST